MQIKHDTQSFYERMGGEEVLKRLVERFYQHMNELEQAKQIRDMHAVDLKPAQEKLFMFLSGWLGGPPLYMEKYGHPRLRMRHLLFAINEQARDQWMLCMQQALSEIVADQKLQEELPRALFGVVQSVNEFVSMNTIQWQN
ncbi:MAG: group II truncated hemoglobin [Mariprofundaceae bacterium]